MDQHRLAAVLALWMLSIVAPGGADPISISGKVLDAQGRALPGARVELAPLALEGRSEPKPVSTVSSDGEGFFSLAAPDAGMWTVRVEAAGFVPNRLDLIPLLEALELQAIELRPGIRRTEPARITLTPGPERLTGRVLDRLTGKPLAGAFVWPREDPGAAVRTDAAGIYTLVGPPQGDLAAAALRYFPAEAAVRWQAASPYTGPDFALSPAAAVAGKVVDPQGRPIEGVELEAQPAGAALPSRLQARSDARGRFSLRALDPARTWELRAVRRGFLPATLPLADLKPLSSRSDLRIVLRPGRSAFGTVIDEAGHPVAGAEVSLLPADETSEPDFAAHRELVARTSSDPKGRFELDTLPAARVDLEVRAPGFVPALVRGLAVAPGNAAFDLGSVILVSGERVAGRVEDPQGRPLEAVAITVQRVDPTSARLAWAGSPPRPSETVTGADGQFEVGGLRPGEPVDLLVRRQGYVSRTVPGLRPPLEEPVQVVLSPASRISGRVLDEKDAPIVSAQVILRREGGIAGAGSTDGEGRFTLEGVQSGRFALDVSAQAHLPVRRDGIEVMSGTDVEDLEIVLPRGAALEGTVYAPDGSPAPGVEVRALPPPSGGPSPLFVVPETHTDGKGRYRLEGLREGRYSVVAEHPAYAKALRDLEIREDETRLDLRLKEAWEVAGRAVDASGQGIAGVRVGLTGPDGGERETVSGPDGAFHFAGIGEGRHRLRAEKQGYARPQIREFQVAGGPVRDLELRLDQGAALTGQIRGLAFEDLARVQVAATRAGIPGEQTGRIDYQGQYRVDDLAPGDWIALARLPDGRLAEGRVTVQAGAREVMLDLEFEKGLSLSGRVLAGAAPVAGALVHLRTGEGSGGGGRSGPQGEFRIEGLKPGIYTLLVIAPPSGLRHEETLEVQTDREIVIELAAPGAARSR